MSRGEDRQRAYVGLEGHDRGQRPLGDVQAPPASRRGSGISQSGASRFVEPPESLASEVEELYCWPHMGLVGIGFRLGLSTGEGTGAARLGGNSEWRSCGLSGPLTLEATGKYQGQGKLW